jgi:hypothetical protein
VRGFFHNREKPIRFQQDRELLGNDAPWEGRAPVPSLPNLQETGMAERHITEKMMEAGIRAWIQFEDVGIIKGTIDGELVADIIREIYSNMARAEPKPRFEPTSKKEGDIVI